MANSINVSIKVRANSPGGAAVQGAEVYLAILDGSFATLTSYRWETDASGVVSQLLTPSARDGFFELRVRKPNYGEYWQRGGLPWKDLGGGNFSVWVSEQDAVNVEGTVVLVNALVPEPQV